MAVPFADLQAVAPSSVIELFELELRADLHGSSEVWRFHAGSSLNANGNIVWAGETYLRFPVEAEGFEYNGQGQLPRPRLRASNVLNTLSAILLSVNDFNPGNNLGGAKVSRIRTLARYLDAVNFPDGINPLGTPDPTAEFPREVYFVDRKVAETAELVELELAAAFDLAGVRAPKRQCISNICQWVYRSPECGYTEQGFYNASDEPVATAGQDVCGKRLNSCRVRFEAIEKTGSVVKDSTTLALDSTERLLPGHPIFGFGIPSGTTVVSITNATQLVMSQAAQVTNPVTQTGTVSSTGPTMTVANGANLRAGMTVTGLYVPEGTAIASISGNTVTLTNRPYEFSRKGVFGFAKSSTSFLFTWLRYIYLPLFGIDTGYRVFGSHQVNTTVSGKDTLLGAIALASYGLLANISPSLDSKTDTTLYFIPSSPQSATYTFSSSTQVVFRTQEADLPYGSFPGIGAYFT